MLSLTPTSREKRIWDTDRGDILIAKKTMHGENYPFPDIQLFTEAKEYAVIEVKPLWPCVIVLDDTGNRNHVDGDFIQNFERRKITPRVTP